MGAPKSQTATQRRRELRAKALNYLGGKCRICGYARCAAALDFHHPNPNAKEFSISARMSLPWELIVRELDKCLLLCANCHRETHDGMHPHYLDYELAGDDWGHNE